MTGTGTMLTLRGTGNKRGCAIGKTEYLVREDYPAHSPAGEPRREIIRLERAIEASREELFSLYRSLVTEIGESEAWIFLMQTYLLDGSLFSGTPRFYIAEGKSAEEALLLSYDDFKESLLRAPYLSDISEDARDVMRRVMRHLSGNAERRPASENFILLCPSPSASEIYTLSDELIGIVAKTEWDKTSAALLARALFIPAVLTDSDFCEVEAGKNAIIDSLRGAAYIDPDLETVEHFTNSQKIPPFGNSKHRKLPLLAEPSSLIEAYRICESDLDGIGLFHSEELYLRSVAPPDEETLFDTYRTLAESLLPRPLVIRTFSVSGQGRVRINKMTVEGKNEPELYVFHDETLTRQLRAALRAAVFGTLALAVPVGDSYDAVNKIKELIPAVSDELKYEKREHRKIPVGAIIDTAPALIVCDKFIDLCDFLIVKFDALSFSEAGDLAKDAKHCLLERAAKTAKRKKKPALLCIAEKLDANELPLIKKLGFSALIIPPDDTEYFI